MWYDGLPITTVVPYVVPVWQLAHPDVMPVWFIVQVTKPPGVTVLVWHVPQSSVVEMCEAGFATTPAVCPP